MSDSGWDVEAEAVVEVAPRPHLVAVVESAVCTSCKVEKPLSEFNRDRTKPNGRRRMCIVCRRERDAFVKVYGKPQRTSVSGDVVVVERVVYKEREPSGEEWAWIAAMERLAANHEREALGLIYSERAQRGLIDGVAVPRSNRERDKRSSASMW